MAKFAREAKLRERREEKEFRKAERKQAALNPEPDPVEVDSDLDETDVAGPEPVTAVPNS